MKQSAAYKKGYKHGYNNPSSFVDPNKLLNSSTDMAKGVIAGICKRKEDDQNGTAKYVQ